MRLGYKVELDRPGLCSGWVESGLRSFNSGSCSGLRLGRVWISLTFQKFGSGWVRSGQVICHLYRVLTQCEIYVCAEFSFYTDDAVVWCIIG